MGIFRKNKRQFGICSHRRVFVALFLVGILSISGIISFILRAQAADGPIRSIEIFSEHANFSNNEQGAWKITKSAKWTSKTTAQVSFEIDSITKPSGNDKDIILVLDNSSSMDDSFYDNNTTTSKLEAIKTNAAELINNTLDNQDSQISIISFATDAEIVVPFTNDVDALITGLNSIEAYGSTNYYKALVRVGEVLADYEIQADRDIVVLFVTDGVPVKQTPLEVVEYRALKSQYESLIINAVQYDMGDTIISQLARISDNQFIVQDAAQLDKSLFDAASVPYYYQSFNVADYVDTDYWTLDDVSVNLGTVTMDTNEQSVDWNLGRYFRPGQETKPHLTISLNLKEEFHEADSRFSTNVREIASSSIIDGEDENISSNETPVLQHKYNVSYDANLPASCDNSVELPGSNRYFVFDTVEIQGVTLFCEGYKFMGWQLATAHVVRINTDYFRMPEADVVLRAIWAKPSIGKSMDGTVHQRVSAEFDTGINVNYKMRRLAGETSPYWGTDNSKIKLFRRAGSLDNSIDIHDDKHVVSSRNSNVPIYIWFDDLNGIIYYYSEADDIYLNSISSYFFAGLSSLEDLNDVADWNSSNVTTMETMFRNDRSITSLEPLRNWDVSNVRSLGSVWSQGAFSFMSSIDDLSPLSNWDISNVEDLGFTFCGISAPNLDAISGWNTSNVKMMWYTFCSTTNLSNIDALSGWDTSSVTNMSGMFSFSRGLINIDGALNWDTSNVTTMGEMFQQATSLTNVNGARKWDTSNVTNMSSMFSSASSLTDITGIAGWDTSKVVNMNYMFSSTKIANIDPLANWDTSSVTNMKGMFNALYETSVLQNIDGALKWDTSNVTDMSSMFAGTTALDNIDGAVNWDTSSVTSFSNMFQEARSLKNIDGALKWDTSSVTSMSNMFQGAKSLKNIDGAIKWDTSNVTSMSGLFYGAASLENVNGALDWDTSKVTTLKDLFHGAGYTMVLSDISGLRKWDTSNVTDMQGAFRGVSGITNVDDLLNWDTSKVTNMFWMFDGYQGGSSLTNVDGLRKWNVSSVKNMSYMFRSTPLNDISGLSEWITSSVTNIDGMFNGANNITNIDALSDWDTSKVTSFYLLFSAANSLSDISGVAGWETGAVTNMRNVFSGTSITNLDDLSGWNTSNVVNMESMFSKATSLSDISGISEWDVSSVTNMKQMFYSDTAITSLSPLEGWEPTNLENSTDMFYNIPDSVTRPSWYQ